MYFHIEFVRMGERQDKGGGYRVMKLMKNKKRESRCLSLRRKKIVCTCIDEVFTWDQCKQRPTIHY